MTRQQAAFLYDTHQVFLALETSVNTSVVLAMLSPVVARFRSILDSGGYDMAMAMVDPVLSESLHRGLLLAIYTRTGPIAAESEFVRLTPVKSEVASMQTKDRTAPADRPDESNDPFDLLRQLPQPQIGFFSAIWRDKMVGLLSSSETAKRISGMTAHTRQKVRDILVRGKQEGFSVRWAAKQIAGFLTGKQGRRRANLIARTESTRAASAGHEAGAMSTNLKLKKRWVATRDSRTRDPHRAMLSKPDIDRDELFTVGGKKMKYPGDPAGGAANVVNCRCRVLYIPA